MNEQSGLSARVLIAAAVVFAIWLLLDLLDTDLGAPDLFNFPTMASIGFLLIVFLLVAVTAVPWLTIILIPIVILFWCALGLAAIAPTTVLMAPVGARLAHSFDAGAKAGETREPRVNAPVGDPLLGEELHRDTSAPPR